MKEKKYLIYGICLVLISLVGLTYAYFAIIIQGDKKKVTVNTTDLRIIFDNGDNIEGTNIEPGWSITKTFSVENKTSNEYKYNLVFKDLINTFVTKGYLVYKITSTNNGYNMSDYKDIPKSNIVANKVIEYSVPISSNTKQEYTIEIKYISDDNVDQGDDMGKELSAYLYIEEGTKIRYDKGTLAYKLLEDNTLSERTDFATPFTETTTGTLFTSTESITGITSTPQEVYYYAGNTTNNWVKFGKNSSGTDLYWRIIRTNHDGSIRLLYVGTNHDTTSGNIGTSRFNAAYMSSKYVGYMYGTSGSLENNRTNENDSTIKTAVDTWYQKSLTNYTKYLSTSAVYCNDRSEEVGSYGTSQEFNFASYKRLYTDKTPTYNCSDIRDAFSVENTSAQLDYPIALMTADEIAFAGGVASKTMSTPYAWFISNSSGTQVSRNWWSMSPIGCRGGGMAYEWRWDSYETYLDDYGGNVIESYAVRPAISLKSCALYGTGDGTAENPYTIQETESGC